MGNKFQTTSEDIKRFVASIKQGKRYTDCWKWLGTKVQGYGVIFVDGKNRYAHRFSFLIHNGCLDEEKLVCHSCDNPECTNPLHLFLGTDADNRKDAVRKNRIPKGSELPFSKLNEEAVKLIKRDLPYRTNVALAKEYGVDYRAISDIRVGRTWKHVDDSEGRLS